MNKQGKGRWTGQSHNIGDYGPFPWPDIVSHSFLVSSLLSTHLRVTPWGNIVLSPHHGWTRPTSQAVTAKICLCLLAPRDSHRKLIQPLKMIQGRKRHGWKTGGPGVHRKAGRVLNRTVSSTWALSKHCPGQELIRIIILILHTRSRDPKHLCALPKVAQVCLRVVGTQTQSPLYLAHCHRFQG